MLEVMNGIQIIFSLLVYSIASTTKLLVEKKIYKKASVS